MNAFIVEFSTFLQRVKNLNKLSYISGDYNIDLLKVKINPRFGEFFDHFISSGFFPKITLPTRFTDQSATLIDNVFKSVIVPITEYACPAWHTSLTKHDTDTLENIQKRAMSVIFPGLKYHDALKTSKLPTLSTRRDLLCKAFFIQMSNPEHKLNYLLEKRHEHPYELRHNQKFKIEIPHTERYKNSFVMHSLVNYQ